MKRLSLRPCSEDIAEAYLGDSVQKFADHITEQARKTMERIVDAEILLLFVKSEGYLDTVLETRNRVRHKDQFHCWGIWFKRKLWSVDISKCAFWAVKDAK